MAGKSTYMRQTALIVLMAQIGSFVPAEKANIGIVDRDLQSRSIRRSCQRSEYLYGRNDRSCQYFKKRYFKKSSDPGRDRRGTSTFDGLAIAWAVIEHISDTRLCGAKTLFATHYHELTELEGKIPGVNNYCIAVKEKGD